MMPVNVIAASQRFSLSAALLVASFIGPNYSAGVAFLSTVHRMQANASASAAAAPPYPFTFTQSRSRAAVELEAFVGPFLVRSVFIYPYSVFVHAFARSARFGFLLDNA